MIKASPALFAALVGAGTLVVSILPSASAASPQLGRVSVTSAAAEMHGSSSMAAVSADGRFVAFASDAPDIVPNNTANLDIFVHDRQTGMTELVSQAASGSEADGNSIFPGISANGRYVVFESFAGNLVSEDDGFADIYVRDRETGTTRRVNLTPEGAGANNDSLTPAISASGRFVTYTSLASNILPADDNGARDVFLVDLETNVTELISVATDGTQGDVDSGGFGAGGGHVTGDGRYVVYGSFAGTLVANDSNNKDDIFVRDRINGTTERVSVATDGTEGDDHSMYGAISEDGRYVVYFSSAGNLVPEDNNGVADVFLRDRQTGETTRISGGTGMDEANGGSRFPDISDNGRFVVYQSSADNLAPNDTNVFFDIFRYDIQTGETTTISVSVSDDATNGSSTSPQISADGSVVSFQSVADNLIPVDLNFEADVFVWGKPLGATPTATPTRSPAPTATATPAGRVGDANGDGRIDAIDAALALQFTAGLLPALSARADANLDGLTNSIDAALILQFTAGLLTSLPR